MQRRLLLMNVLLLVCSLTSGQERKSLNDTIFIQGDTLDIPELIFDLSYPMRPETNDSLDLVIDFLYKHPDLIVELALHTDSRGSVEANQKISEYRGQHVCNYMYSKLKDESYRVNCKGYGESYLQIKVDEIERVLTREENELLHQQNRRTELIVKEIK